MIYTHACKIMFTLSLTFYLFFVEEKGKPVDCNCSNPSSSCINIAVPPNDPFYENKTTCIMLKGSLKVSGCESFPVEQVNRLSAYIDAETVYGWNEELLSDLRVPDSGKNLNQPCSS